jgi:hypothetical protein
MKSRITIISVSTLFFILCHIQFAKASTMDITNDIMSLIMVPFLTIGENVGPLPLPIVTKNSVEICLNSRYSQHSLRGTASIQQLSNILWAAGKAPFAGGYRNMYVLTPTGTYLYDPNSHSLSWHSSDVRDEGAFTIRYESELDFDTGVSFMPALLASVSLCNSTEAPMASCPKGLGYPKTRLYFGVQSTKALTSQLLVHCSIPEGEPGWLPDPCTVGDNSLEEVLADLKYVNNFIQTNLTPRQISQILWAGYGCSAHTTSNSRAGLTVPSAFANYYLTQSIYLVNENGVFRYHNRNPNTNMATRDHRLEQLSFDRGRRRQPVDVNDSDIIANLQSAISDLPQAPCYVILCLDSSYVGQEYARLETGFVASSMLIQATAIDLGCHFKTKLTSDEQKSVQTATNIPSSHIPQAIVSIGSIATRIFIYVGLQGYNRPETGWTVPLTVKFFVPGANILSDTPSYEFNLTSTRSTTDTVTGCEIIGVLPGTYDISANSECTLSNVKKNVVISEPNISFNMGILLEGNSNQDDIINLNDFGILSKSWLTSNAQSEYDSRADFDRNGIIDIADLCLLTDNWLISSPVEIKP